MASLNYENGDRQGYKLRWRDPRKRQRVIWLGDVSKKSAATYLRHISELIDAQAAGRQPQPETEKWLRSKQINSRVRSKLTEYALAEPENEKLGTDAGTYLGPYCDSYIAGRTDCKQGTLDNFGHARRLLIEYFGSRQTLTGITPEDCERWKRWLLTEKRHAQATASKHIKRAKTLFAAAVNDRLLSENPFRKVKTGSEANDQRHYEVTAGIAADVIAECPDDDWRIIFALARYGGMRCPSEVLTLKWSDVLWEQKKLRIDSPKTGLRFCPIFPELAPILEAAFDAAPDGATFCVQRYRQGYNPATTMKKIIERAGHEPWPKLFINCRSTRRTELQRQYPDHVINKWLGHSSAVAEQHYLQVTKDDWTEGATRPTISEARQTIPQSDDHKCRPNDSGGNAGGNAGGNGLAELCDLWSSLDHDARAKLLNTARSIHNAQTIDA